MEVLRERPVVADLRDREVVPLVEVPVGRRLAEPEQRQGGAVEPARLLEVGNADRDVVEHRSALVGEVALVTAVPPEREVQLAVVDLEALGVNFAARTFVAGDDAGHRVVVLDWPGHPHLDEPASTEPAATRHMLDHDRRLAHRQLVARLPGPWEVLDLRAWPAT